MHSELPIGKRGVLLNAKPEHIGPGYWDKLHSDAWVFDTSLQPNARDMFVEVIIRGIGLHFKCLDCRKHALEYMVKIDPVRNLLGNKATPGIPNNACGEWVYRFHEAVNDRLGKPRETRPTFAELDEFLAGLREGKGCADCGHGQQAVHAQPSIVKLRRQLVD